MAEATGCLAAGCGAAKGGVGAICAAEGRAQVYALPVAAYLLAYEATVIAAAAHLGVRIGVDAKLVPVNGADIVKSDRALALAGDALREFRALVSTCAAIVKVCAGVDARSAAKHLSARARAGAT